MYRIVKPEDFKKPRRAVNRCFIHCSASDSNTEGFKGVRLAETIDAWHKARGWSGIGYHFVVDKTGTLSTGRDLEKIPAAQAGHNRGTIAICLHGLDKDKFTMAQRNTLIQFCNAVNKAYRGNITFHGHCEVSAKSCPVIDYKEILLLDEKGRLGMKK